MVQKKNSTQSSKMKTKKKDIEPEPVFNTYIMKEPIINTNPRVKNSKKYDKTMKELKIDETYTNPKPQTQIKYDHVKDSAVPKEDYAFQSDLLMLPITKLGFRYLLVIVDLWSDEIDAEPLKTKTPQVVLEAMKTIFKRPHLNKPFHMKTDAGTEFKAQVKDYFFDESIYHSVALPGRHKQTGSVENVNRLLGRFLMTYLTNKEKELKTPYYEWTDILTILITKLNKIRKRKDGDPFDIHKPANLDLIEKQKYNVGDIVYRKLDIPKNALNIEEKDNPKFRQGDLRFDNFEPRKIKQVLYYPNNVRYIINGFDNVAYTEDELMFAENEKDEKYAVKQIWDKQIIKKIIYYKVWWRKSLKRNSTWEKKTNLIEDGLLDEINTFEEQLKKKKK